MGPSKLELQVLIFHRHSTVEFNTKLSDGFELILMMMMMMMMMTMMIMSADWLKRNNLGEMGRSYKFITESLK
jgi:hypothetical protein